MNPLWAGSYFPARNHTFLDPDALDLSKDLPPVPFTKLEQSNYPETRAPIDSRSRSRRKPVPYDVDEMIHSVHETGTEHWDSSELAHGAVDLSVNRAAGNRARLPNNPLFFVGL